ncbi:leucyl/phenylalanyl-tRNA--protein transferase [Myxococcota bacterium]
MIRATSFFPDPETADQTGLVAISHVMNAELLLDAYAHGIFPWSEHPVCWYSPDPRAIFLRDRARIPKKMNKAMRRHNLTVTFDRAFEQVMAACSEAHAASGTWITGSFIRAYGHLHRMGYAHSVEVWQDNLLAGGIYGVQLGGMFAGESMFYRVTNASKVAFAHLVDHLDHMGNLLFDAQVINAFTLQLGAVLVRRSDFLQLLRHAIGKHTPWDGRRWPEHPPPLGQSSRPQ